MALLSGAPVTLPGERKPKLLSARPPRPASKPGQTSSSGKPLNDQLVGVCQCLTYIACDLCRVAWSIHTGTAPQPAE